MNQLEELFNERLANHSTTPPAGVWEKVEANLTKKNNRIVWFKAAAVIAIAGSVVLTTLWVHSGEPTETLSDKKETPAAASQHSVATAQQDEKRGNERPAKNKKRKTRTVTPPLAQHVAAGTEAVAEYKAEAQIAASEPEPVTETQTEQKIASRSAMVLTYTLEPVMAIEPVDGAKASDAQADGTKKDSSLGKVVQFAKNVKNGDSSFGLRVMKEDLFALELKKKAPTKKH